jgi:urease accessory protein
MARELAVEGAGPAGDRPLQRARGRVRLSFKQGPAGTAVDTRFEESSGRVRLVGRGERGPAEAVLLNTAGGLTGGDRFEVEVALAAGTEAAVSTQAAERVYRRSEGRARVATRLLVGEGASLSWLPQETILFDRSGLERTLEADCAATGTLLALEATVMGRAAMGETLHAADLRDSWRVRRDGRLVFADGIRLDGDAAAAMAGGATGGGHIAWATVLLVTPDAACRLDAARAALQGAEGECGASAWNGMILVRLLAPSGLALRRDLARLVEALRGAPMPRVWNC